MSAPVTTLPTRDPAALRAAAISAVNEHRMEDALAAFEQLVTADPGAADGWINLATAELSVGRPQEAAANFEKGVSLLRASNQFEPDALASSLLGLGAAREAAGLVDAAAAAFADAFRAHPASPRPLQALAYLLARAGDLAAADTVALEYCKAAVSVLPEKPNVASVRRFQASIQAAASLDGGEILRAAREAYAARFAEVSRTLPPSVRLEAALYQKGEDGKPVLLVPDAGRPFAATRIDAIDTATGDRWMIDETPTYAVPPGTQDTAFAQFPVRWATDEPFHVSVSTRTAWDYLSMRIRFRAGATEEKVADADRTLGQWYAHGFEGGFGTGASGCLHFISPPKPLGEKDLLYEIDLGLADLRAAAALLSSLEAIHRQHSLEAVVLGDAHLPLNPETSSGLVASLFPRRARR
jgi:Flp pilus assembly protein TadD